MDLFWGGITSVATATTAATSAAARESTGRFGGGAVTGAGRGTKNGKLNRVSFAGTLWTSNFLLLVDHNFLEFVAAVFANIFVDRHVDSSFR
jgi:hypothetical protein